jgi:type III restriction enzyme
MVVKSAAVQSWVQKTPGVCGGDPCIRNSRITVHGIVEYRQLGLSDAEILQHIQGLTPADLEVAWQYYAENTAEIEAILRAEAEA